MKIGVDGEAITLDGEIASYAEAREAVEKIFGFAAVMWPVESAEHDAEIEAEAAAARPAPRKGQGTGAKAIRVVKPGSLAEQIKPLWDAGKDSSAIAAEIGKPEWMVAGIMSKMRAGGLIS